jgi:Trk K+ transport system NAD-binding subunit
LDTGDAAVSKLIKEIPLPNDCVIVSIRRGDRVIVPRGNTQLLAGDRVIALPGADGVGVLRKILLQGNTKDAKLETTST